MLCLSFLRQGTVYVPVLGIGEDGRYRHTGEVGAAPVADRDAVERLVRSAIARGNPRLAGTIGTADARSALWLAARATGWAAFEASATGWYIWGEDDRYRLARRSRETPDGLEPRPELDPFPARGIDDVLHTLMIVLALPPEAAAVDGSAPPAPRAAGAGRGNGRPSIAGTLRRWLSPPPPPASGVVAEMIEAAQWMAARLPTLGCRGDYSLDSLADIDRLLDEAIVDGQPKPGGPFAANFGTQMLAVAAYVGEVIRRSRGSRWQWQGEGYKDARDETINIRMRRDDGGQCWPVQRMLKRVQNGSEDGLFAYAVALLDLGTPMRLDPDDAGPHDGPEPSR